eukprot:TRINITY_DN684_c0_g3_i2.p2 TRINITY_DN684_c0_g3~~TRINITY_DN684_c0_g3_i2.p2  ORF type:complete len:113 (-),score=1.92 TRINITY_DN684_c0_g3_i2:95-433(-)
MKNGCRTRQTCKRSVYHKLQIGDSSHTQTAPLRAKRGVTHLETIGNTRGTVSYWEAGRGTVQHARLKLIIGRAGGNGTARKQPRETTQTKRKSKEVPVAAIHHHVKEERRKK